MATTAPPPLPVPIPGLVKHISKHPDTPMTEIFEPYRKYEAHLRQVFAQDPTNKLIKDPYVNVLPLFTEDIENIRIRARNLDAESKEEKSKYIMPLPEAMRRPNGSPAVVQSLKEFQDHFNVFSEASLVDMDWSNVVVAGSAVVNTLLPVPEEYSRSRKGLRTFYHEKFCPASDVDLFLYGLTEEQAIEKIRDIERRVRDALLSDTTVIRTKHAITICSQYPTRHIQIVLRIYKSISEILTGFDIDCSGAAYDGKQVYCTPRALQAFMTQINHIDLTRRSPSYENRLSKYSHRGFEVYWPDLDRSRIDPTIYERSFKGTVGLARLLVLERLPTTDARDSYSDKRRTERGRPTTNRYYRRLRSLAGNIKDDHEDEVADWINEEDVSNYHTFNIPYGPRFTPKRIEKLCYARDLILNAEWSEQFQEREVHLHRHPAFFGRYDDVINDCCGFCPEPKTEEEKEIAAEDSKVYISGRITFLTDDPGRQEIGSFNPLTDDDWTEMAYIASTDRFCQAIVDGDLATVQDWLAQEGNHPDMRDHTGRTPLHLAVMCSTPDIIRALVDAGARLVARLADGRTALHLAAARGDVEIVKILLDKSVANEAEYEERQERRRQQKKGKKPDDEDESKGKGSDHDDASDGELIDDEHSDDEALSITTDSFIKVKHAVDDQGNDLDEEDDPNFYDINVTSWDLPCTALHYAILEGHVDVVKTLVQDYGADVLLPVKFDDNAAVLNLVLPLVLPVEKAVEMVKSLVSLGATTAQADRDNATALYRAIMAGAKSVIDALFEADPRGVQTAINHLTVGSSDGTQSPLTVALGLANSDLVSKLLDHGAAVHIDFETWFKSAKQSPKFTLSKNPDDNQKTYERTVQQPLICALRSTKPEIAIQLLEHGADPNSVDCDCRYSMQNSWMRINGQTALDIVESHLDTLQKEHEELRERIAKEETTSTLASLREQLDACLATFEEGSYQHWAASRRFEEVLETHESRTDVRNASLNTNRKDGVKLKEKAVSEAIATVEEVRDALISKGAKTFKDLYPELKDRLEKPWRRQDTRRSRSEEPAPSAIEFKFVNVEHVSEAAHEAYLKLFNAAFHGDLDTIKSLTLSTWDPEKKEPPLKIAVKLQLNGDDPFWIAFTRGHYDVAKAILEIARAQYAPKEKTKRHYSVEPDDDDSDAYSDYSSETSDVEPIPIYSRIIDEQYTIENVGQVSMQVKSRTRPVELINRKEPLKTVIRNNDIRGLKFLLDVYEHWTTQSLEPDDEPPSFYAFPVTLFREAVQLGRVELLAEIIRRTGAGLPLENLVKQTGMEMKVKPRYYQGLTVYGSKRRDWAQAGRGGSTNRVEGVRESPLMLAALDANLESVKWFLSDAPLKGYLEFANSDGARNDARIQHLAEARGGIERAIKRWLSNEKDLILHAAIYATPSPRSIEVVDYLLKTQPSLLEVTAGNGATPFYLAVRYGRIDIAKMLIEAGAEQAVKISGRYNILHAVLSHLPHPKRLKSMLDLLDRELVVSTLTERNRLSEGGRTVLHQYLVNDQNKHGGSSTRNAIRVLQLFASIDLDATKKALGKLDGSGDTPLHTLVTRGYPARLIRAVINIEPSLLFRENAVGRTPVEVARDKFLSSVVKPPSTYRYSSHQESISVVAKRSPEWYVTEKKEAERKKRHKPFFREHEPRGTEAEIWREICGALKRIAEQQQQESPELPKRTLVSLNAANYVAKRLGEKYTGSRYTVSLVDLAAIKKQQKKEKEVKDGSEEEEVAEVASTSGESQTTGGANDADGVVVDDVKPAPTAAAEPKEEKKKSKRPKWDTITSRFGYWNEAWEKPRKVKEDGTLEVAYWTASENEKDDEDE